MTWIQMNQGVIKVRIHPPTFKSKTPDFRQLQTLRREIEDNLRENWARFSRTNFVDDRPLLWLTAMLSIRRHCTVFTEHFFVYLSLNNACD